jgi:hypothetical protein
MNVDGEEGKGQVSLFACPPLNAHHDLGSSDRPHVVSARIAWNLNPSDVVQVKTQERSSELHNHKAQAVHYLVIHEVICHPNTLAPRHSQFMQIRLMLPFPLGDCLEERSRKPEERTEVFRFFKRSEQLKSKCGKINGKIRGNP